MKKPKRKGLDGIVKRLQDVSDFRAYFRVLACPFAIECPLCGATIAAGAGHECGTVGRAKTFSWEPEASKRA